MQEPAPQDQSTPAQHELVRDLREQFLRAYAEVMRKPSLRRIANWLNQNGVPSPRGSRWHAESVSRVVQSLGPHFQADIEAVRNAAHQKRDAAFWGSA